MDVIADLTGRPVQASLPICNCALVWLRQFWSAVLFRRFWSDILEKIPKYSREVWWGNILKPEKADNCAAGSSMYFTNVSALLHKSVNTIAQSVAKRKTRTKLQNNEKKIVLLHPYLSCPVPDGLFKQENPQYQEMYIFTKICFLFFVTLLLHCEPQ